MGDITLVLGDCLDVMRTVDAGNVDIVLTDPPYGIAADTDYRRYGSATTYDRIIGDDSERDLRWLFNIGKVQIVFGANNFYWQLPRLEQAGWLCWDKRCNDAADKVFGSPFELIWCSRPRTFKMYRVQHGGAINADGANQPRYHPTQKPIRLLTRIITDLTRPGDLVFDPYMGSGTTGIACVQTGRRFLGIEIDPTYYAVAQKRIADAQAQMRMPL